MSAQFTVAHIAQLHEIQRARTKRGQPGIGREVENLIRRLNDHGIVFIDGNLEMAREAQAKRYWDNGVARAVGYKSEKAYLADVPDAPRIHLTNVAMLHPQLLLIEPRIGFAKLCGLAGVSRRQDWVEARGGDAPSGLKPFWIAFDDGRRNRGCTINRSIEVGGNFNDHGFTAFIGVCAVLQCRDFVEDGDDPYYLHLTGTFDKDGQGGYANLIVTGDELQIRDGYKGDESCAVYGIPSYVRY